MNDENVSAATHPSNAAPEHRWCQCGCTAPDDATVEDHPGYIGTKSVLASGRTDTEFDAQGRKRNVGTIHDSKEPA